MRQLIFVGIAAGLGYVAWRHWKDSQPIPQLPAPVFVSPPREASPPVDPGWASIMDGASDIGPCFTRDGQPGYESIAGCLPIMAIRGPGENFEFV
jgi:hypothetical protein